MSPPAASSGQERTLRQREQVSAVPVSALERAQPPVQPQSPVSHSDLDHFSQALFGYQEVQRILGMVRDELHTWLLGISEDLERQRGMIELFGRDAPTVFMVGGQRL